MDYGERDIRKNASGIPDPTAFAAIKNILKEEREQNHMDMMSSYMKGDIVEVALQNGQTQEALILKVNKDFASALYLRDSTASENAITVISKQKMYADTSRIGYIFYDNITKYIKTLPENDFDKVLIKIAQTFEIDTLLRKKHANSETVLEYTSGLTNEDIEKIRTVLLNCIPDLAMNLRHLDTLGTEEEAKEKLIKAEAERDIYKALFEQERNH